MTDFHLHHNGTAYVLYPQTRAAHDWLDDNVDPTSMNWCDGVVINEHALSSLIDSAFDDGLIIETTIH